MIIRTKKSPRTLGLDEPIRHESHKAPVTRRDFIAQGFKTGPAIIAAPAALAMLIGSDNARAMSPDLEALLGPAACAIQAQAWATEGGPCRSTYCSRSPFSISSMTR